MRRHQLQSLQQIVVVEVSVGDLLNFVPGKKKVKYCLEFWEIAKLKFLTTLLINIIIKFMDKLWFWNAFKVELYDALLVP